MTAPKPRGKPKRGYQKHGLTTAKQAIRDYGTDILDGRTKQARKLAEWRESLVEDLGGEESISTQERTLIELAARQIMLLDVIDGFLWSDTENPLANIINKRNRRLYPIAKERQAISNGLASLLSQLGISKRTAEAIPLTDYIIERYGNEDDAA